MIKKLIIKIIIYFISFCFVFSIGVLFCLFYLKDELNNHYIRYGQKIMADYFYNEILNNFGSWSTYDEKEKKYEIFGGIDLKGPRRIDFVIINDVKSIIVYEYK